MRAVILPVKFYTLEVFKITLSWLFSVFVENSDKVAIIWNEDEYTYGWLLNEVEKWQNKLIKHGIVKGDVVAIEGDYSPTACALLFALINNNTIIVPISNTLPAEATSEFIKIANVKYHIIVDNVNSSTVHKHKVEALSVLIKKIIDSNNSGLVLFSSGSTGKSKGSVHNFNKLLEKYSEARKVMRCLGFLLFDHIGGINTLFSILSSGGTLVAQNDRKPGEICRLIEKYQIELLPTSPTFINLLIISEEYKKYDLSSLKLITYGTEVMPEFTLKKANSLFPWVKFKQTYGLSEIGIVGTKSENDSSLWLKLGGRGYDYEIRDNILWIKAESSMLGYLNAPNPFDEDGWFNTQDMVVRNGDYVKILGRKTEVINVGGQKVYPAEVENLLLEINNIKDVVVYGEKNNILGNIVCAKIVLSEPEDFQSLKERVLLYCRDRLESYKIPFKIVVTEESLMGNRLKKIRK